jgi:hypothetical protein
MSAATLSTISLIGYIAAGVLLAAAVVLFFVFKIPTVIGDLSGRTARKSIAKQRAANESSGSKSFRPSEGNVARGKITESMPDAKKQKAKPPAAPAQAAVPQRPAAPPQQRPAPPRQQRPAQNADPMQQGTGMYEENKIRGVAFAETEMLSDPNETVALDDGNATVPLEEPAAPAAKPVAGKRLTLVNEIMLIHTDEVI